MKYHLILVIGLFCGTAFVANGQFERAMGKNIPAVFSESNPEALQATINQLIRIGEAEGNRWEPYYYAAFGYIQMSGLYESGDDKDKFLDLSLETIEKGEEIKPDESELAALRGYAQMIKLTVDPATRGMTYSGLAFSAYQKALQLNPENPRAHYLMGQMQYGTAQFMGGGNEQACESLAKAKNLFANQETSDRSIAPSWGMKNNEEAIRMICESGE